MASHRVRNVLLIDRDDSFFRKLKASGEYSQFNLLFMRTTKEAKKVLADRSKIIAAVFLNANVADPHYITTIREAYLERPATPIYLIEEENAPRHQLSDQDLESLGIRKTIRKKDLTLNQIKEFLQPLDGDLDIDKVLLTIKREPGQHVNFQASIDDFEFFPVKSEDFVSGTKSLFDVFVRIQSGRYIKVLFSGDSFDPERVINYINKGAAHLHIKKDAQNGYVHYCDLLSNHLLNMPNVPIELKASQVLNFGDQIERMVLDKTNVTEEDTKYAKNFVSNVNKLVNEIKDNGDHALFHSFLEDVKATEHGTAVTMLCNILANHIEIKMDKAVQIVGLAAFFHDVGLSRLPRKLWSEDESSMTPEEYELFKTHTDIGAEIASNISGMAPASVQAIKQHHMRKEGKGFPPRGHGIMVSKMSEMIGICDEYHRLLQKSVNNEKMDIKAEFESKIAPAFSKQIVYAFRTAFFPTVKAVLDSKKEKQVFQKDQKKAEGAS